MIAWTLHLNLTITDQNYVAQTSAISSLASQPPGFSMSLGDVVTIDRAIDIHSRRSEMLSVRLRQELR